jgi:hypothetical protein
MTLALLVGMNDSTQSLAPELLDAIAAATKFGRASYIVSVYENLGGFLRDLSWEDFCSELLELHQEGIVELSRLDLVTAADGGLVEASEIRYLTETYHLVRLP